MRRPMIGVLPLYDEVKKSYWMLPGYLEGILAAGGLPVMLPLTEEPELIEALADQYDGFLFTGGHDVSPALYGEEPIPECGPVCAARDRMECALLRAVLARDKAVFGICRGIQLINAALGGTLYQDLPRQHPSRCEHHQRPPYDIPCHAVRLEPESPLAHLLGRETLEVNSYHHQAVRRLAPDLAVMASAPDGLTEAVCLPGKAFVWAVQWHPEFSFRADPSGLTILKAFVRAAGGQRGS